VQNDQSAASATYSSSRQPAQGKKARCRPISILVLRREKGDARGAQKAITPVPTIAQQAAQERGVQGGHIITIIIVATARATPRGKPNPASADRSDERVARRDDDGQRDDHRVAQRRHRRLQQNENSPRSGLDRGCFFHARMGYFAGDWSELRTPACGSSRPRSGSPPGTSMGGSITCHPPSPRARFRHRHCRRAVVQAVRRHGHLRCDLVICAVGEPIAAVM